jgi:hypothetical protein
MFRRLCVDSHSADGDTSTFPHKYSKSTDPEVVFFFFFFFFFFLKFAAFTFNDGDG